MEYLVSDCKAEECRYQVPEHSVVGVVMTPSCQGRWQNHHHMMWSASRKRYATGKVRYWHPFQVCGVHTVWALHGAHPVPRRDQQPDAEADDGPQGEVLPQDAQARGVPPKTLRRGHGFWEGAARHVWWLIPVKKWLATFLCSFFLRFCRVFFARALSRCAFFLLRFGILQRARQLCYFGWRKIV